MKSPATAPAAISASLPTAILDLPPLVAPLAPDAGKLWFRLAMVGWIVLAAFLLDRLCLLLMDYWLLDSLDLSGLFWTNFRMGAIIFAVVFLSNLFMIGPALAAGVSPVVRRVVVHVGLMEGLITGYWFSQDYLQFLIMNGKEFGYTDPVFGLDAGWYTYAYPAYWKIWTFLFQTALATLASAVLCAYLSRDESKADAGLTRFERVLGSISTRYTRYTVAFLGLVVAYGWWLKRFDLLLVDNSDASVFTGATFVDVTGLFSTLNDYWVTAVLTLGVTGIVVVLLGRLHDLVHGKQRADWRAGAGKLVVAAVLLCCVDFAFKAGVALRSLLFVTPNEPVIQLPYIREHVAATRRAYGFDKVETVRFVPKDTGDPLPDVGALLNHPSLRNAPLWPGFCSYLDDVIDIQHKDRVFLTGGETLVYGPLLEVFRQQQKLRPYYEFLDVDTIRYTVNGEMRMLASAVREVPLLEPEPWLAWWGQQFMLFTHGHGLVTVDMAQFDSQGNPVYQSAGIPATSAIPELQAKNQSVYYGEGSGSMAYTNVREMKELDFPTDEGRAEVVYSPATRAGVPIDSLLKRLVFGYKSGQFFEILFSDLIADETRVHYYRTPIERLNRVAPFLHYDSDPFAVVADDRLVWLVNGMTHTDKYPYSRFDMLGDKSDKRGPIPQPPTKMNYVRDAVKATIDAYTGRLHLYTVSDCPILATLADIYPELFTPGEEMPAPIRRQIQYPIQLLHTQFDDLYVFYQMSDTMTFFNMEDMWDDADEVLGPMIDQGLAVRFSIEPYNMIVRTGDGLLPAAKQQDQFALAMVFTPESALNLRAIPIVYQDGEDYGRIVCLQVPKGHFFQGPEQADAAIDQRPEIAQHITWWNRRGSDVIRGHTTTLIVDGEVLYVEPLFIRSQQNPVPQLKRVCVTFRGKTRMGETLAEALQLAVEAHRES